MRFQKLDIARGVAIVLMVAFHANYLLVHSFGNTRFDIDAFWRPIGHIAAILFLFISGVVFFLSERDRTFRETAVRALRRSAVLAIVAIGISVSTFFLAERFFVVFGIIHFFTLSSLLLPIFIPFWTGNIALGIASVFTGIIFDMIIVESTYLYIFGLKSADFASGDYYPIFPWFGVVLLGYGSAKWLYDRGVLNPILQGKIRWGEWLALLGRHSLLVYVLHVPLLYGIFLLMFGR